MSDDQSHPFGKPVTVMKFSDTGEIIADNKEVENIFNNDEIQDRKIVIISMIGAFRGGKSYFLNYCLRFLYAHYSSINNPKVTGSEFLFEKDQNWMGTSDEPLIGFSWRSGVKRDTIGITIWSDVFLHTIERTGEKIAIVVMDTQGLFDKHSSPTDNSRIFVLSNLISSVQILNLANRIQEDQLQYLQLTIEFALFSLKKKAKAKDGKSFQNLLFLIRDWNNSDDHSYGIKGGEAYLKKVMKRKSNQKPELQSVRKTISSCFDDVGCCLLPNPGKGVSRGKDYNGCWSAMDEEFKDELQIIIECLLLPENLIIKKINSMDVTVRDMKQFLIHYMKLFQSNQIPEVSNIYELTVESFMYNLIDKCFDDYKLTIYRNQDIINAENIFAIHEKCKERSLKLFDSEKKMGNSTHTSTFKLKLEEEIVKFFVDYREQKEENLEKLKEARTKSEETIKKDLKRKEQIKMNISRIKSQLEEHKSKKSSFLSVFYDEQEEVLKTRLAREEQELKKIDKKEQMEKIFTIVLLSVAGISVPFSAISAAGVVAAGASNLTAMAAVGFFFDSINIFSSSFSLIQGTKRFFLGRKNKE